MSFYEELSRYYDEIFATTPAEMAFIRQRLSGRQRLLDIGCGTGNKTELLAEAGRQITGLDLDEGMIEKARTLHAPPGLDYLRADMLGISELFPPAHFDGLICLGNTLPHLTEAGEAAKFVEALKLAAAPEALLVIQVLNYDHIRAANLKELPLIETEHCVFRRFYDWPDGELRFRTRLEVKGGQTYENDIPLRPIFKADLAELLAPGFQSLEFFGGYDGRPWQPDSFVTLLTALRKAEKNS
jgi:2-polyprenyl-3-methyl-5-hydroxy-6-metoxy-1,4-benzoquinol methylase